MPAPPDEPVLEIALVGAGPTASSLLERLAASAPELLGGRRWRVHLIDPHRAGIGRVWRPDLHPGLWMNSMAEDVTMFTDQTVACAGPIVPGPSLYEWASGLDDASLAELPAPLAGEIAALAPTTFPTRRVQSAYLDWVHRRVLAALPAGAEVVVHPHRAIDVVDGDGGSQLVRLDGGAGDQAGDVAAVRADVVVLALGHLDAEPGDDGAALAEFARRHGLTYVPAGHTAELDLSALAPGSGVLAFGFGQAFTDLLVLLTEGRGGRFVDAAPGSPGGVLRYEPSGLEPVIHVGSRRGVPYRSKLGYRLQGPRAPLPRFLDDATIERLVASAPLDFRRDVLPLVVREVAWAYYHELFHAHPERTALAWERFDAAFAGAGCDAARDAVVAGAVPDPADRFDVARLDRPLDGLAFERAADLHRHVAGHVAADVARRTDPAFSADLGAFDGLLATFGTLGRLGAALTPRSRVEDLGGWWFSFFMYYASGPPPARLRQLLALAEAGIVRFVGAGVAVAGDEATGTFVATSASHPEQLRVGALVDARIAAASVSRTRDELLARLRDRGEVLEEIVEEEIVEACAGGETWSANTGKVVVAGDDLRVVRADGTVHPRRHALGAFTNRPAAGAFSRPRTNAPSFRQNDTVARAILTTLAQPRSCHAGLLSEELSVT